MSPARFEPLKLGTLLDHAFGVYRANFLRLLAIVAVAKLPLAVVSMLLAPAGTDPWTYPVGYEGVLPPGIWLAMLVAGLDMVASWFCYAAVGASVAGWYLGRDVTVSQAWGQTLRRTGTLILAALPIWLVAVLVLVLTAAFSLPAGLPVLALFFLLGVPALWLLVFSALPVLIIARWAVTIPTILVERAGAGRALKRSSHLTWGQRGKAYWVLMFVLMLTLLFTVGFSSVVMMISGIGEEAEKAFDSSSGDRIQMRENLMVMTSQALGDVLITPLAGTALVLLYFDRRIRREGFDLEHMAWSAAPDRKPGPAASPRAAP